jgi:hypothetical protein
MQGVRAPHEGSPLPPAGPQGALKEKEKESPPLEAASYRVLASSDPLVRHLPNPRSPPCSALPLPQHAFVLCTSHSRAAEAARQLGLLTSGHAVYYSSDAVDSNNNSRSYCTNRISASGDLQVRLLLLLLLLSCLARVERAAVTECAAVPSGAGMRSSSTQHAAA